MEIQKKRLVSVVLLGTMFSSLLTGCSGGISSLTDDVNSHPPMTIEEVAGTRLVASTNQELESEIFQYVSDRIVVDGSKLIRPTSKDEANITTLLANINTQLQGKGGNVLSDEYANYLLLEFAKTPFEWQQSNKEIVGFDPASRLYFVDVTYTTTTTRKSVVPDSKIPLGDPDASRLQQKRYMDYITMLSVKSDSNGYEKYPILRDRFIKTWGEIEDIFKEQQGVSLYERTKEKGTQTGGIGKLTYSGLVTDNRLAKGAKMTVRYVLKYALNLGEETDLVVEALYLKGYELNGKEDILKSYKLEDKTALEVLKPFIDQLILSYHKCVEESNHIGLYSLFHDYSTIDKYYDEIRDYTYNSVGGHNYQILERKNNGKEVAVKVNRVNQIRARGAEMSLPTYEEELIYNIVLGKDDTIYLKDIYLLKSTLIGEPLSVIKNVTGISDQIQYSDVAFSEDNKVKVEELLKRFSQVVTNGDYSSDEFLACVDMGISSNTLNRMADYIKSIVPKQKAMYIVSWDTKTNVYCSVTVREVFECENGNIDTEAVIDMGNRNGEWKIVNYTRTVNIKTNAQDVREGADNALCINERKVAGETTQIVGSTERNEVELNKPVESAPVENTPVEETPIETPSVETEVVDGETSGGMVETPVDGEGSMTSENVSDSVSDSTGSAGSVSEFS